MPFCRMGYEYRCLPKIVGLLSVFLIFLLHEYHGNEIHKNHIVPGLLLQ